MATTRNLLSKPTLPLSLLLLIGVGVILVRSQTQSEKEVIDRFQIRAEIGAKFLTAYVADLLARETVEAAIELSRDVSAQQFTRSSRALGFPAAVLLDEAGRLLAVEPPSAALLGTKIGGSYAHLSAALEGRATVSNVVSSASRSVPVVGFAVPFETDHGRRVFSGALTIADTTLGSSYLQNIVPFADAHVFLVDGTRATIASSLAGAQTADLMQQQQLHLWEAIASANEGRYEGFGKARRFAVAPVEGTPWRLVISAPEDDLLAAVTGSRWISGLLFAALGFAVAAVIVMSRHIANSRALQLAALEKLSLTDSLTGLYNRRGHELLAAQVLRSAARDKKRVAIVFLDLNGLKRVNDELGHEAGDRMLLSASDLLRRTFRDSDVIARLGGDEFCIVGAAADAEIDRDAFLLRLKKNLVSHNETRVNEPPLSLSIGLTWWEPRDPKDLGELVREADAQMYEDKRVGRVDQSPIASLHSTTSGSTR